MIVKWKSSGTSSSRARVAELSNQARLGGLGLGGDQEPSVPLTEPQKSSAETENLLEGRKIVQGGLKHHPGVQITNCCHGDICSRHLCHGLRSHKRGLSEKPRQSSASPRVVQKASRSFSISRPVSSNMLLVLVYLAALSQLADSQVIDVTACPMYYFGQIYKTFYVSKTKLENDCVLVKHPTVNTAVKDLQSTSKPLGSNYHVGLPQLQGTSSCYSGVDFFESSTSKLIVAFRQFQTQSAQFIYVRDSSQVEVTQLLGGVKVDVWTARGVTYTDISACRHSGVVLKPNQEGCGSDRTFAKCSSIAVLTLTPFRCNEPDATCTVTASSAIDFSGSVDHVPGRCAYSLLSHLDVQLLAVFQDRRRKDVSFLDHVILKKTGVSIHLGQSGRVQLNNALLRLDSSPLLLHGVALSKDQTGVTAFIPFPGFNMSVFFDGNTAQIHMTGSLFSYGLCHNSSSLLSDVKSSEFSSPSCEMQYPEPADRTINCTMMTERCNLLREAPFTTCHNHTDPEPFIAACTNTLCSYPAVDGLSQCQFLEAYARACSLQTNTTLHGWRSTTGCSSSQVVCQDTVCSAHEFCAQDISGGTSCFCRATFASKYRSTNTLGEPTVCGQNSASVSLVGCLLEEDGIDYSMLHLNDQSCKGQMDNLTHMVTFNFDSSNTCGTVVMANGSQIIYKNTIMTQNSSASDIITRQDEVKIDFSCFYTQPDIKSMAFRIKDSSVIEQIVSGAWNYTLTMKAYSDADRTQAIDPSTEILLQQAVWVELKTEGLDDKLVALVTDSCWATNQPSPSESLRYDLIVKGCPNPADKTVKVGANGLGTSNYFSFNMFQFSGKTGDVYLHCKLNLCVRKNNTCAPSCGRPGRRRRSARYEDGSSAFITMAWKN
ncbi:uncharacterized protein LOC121194439 [Toxotes jaculatrix]|uniref:uncharacterized protein LOC121194439 n=1 Tax=Toxotes jaculatrix TaxID=941984 RepID=UPI001B3A9D33|nr:uncharacterized protein LOC121194439 [Toxotes jaculatrix]